MSSVPFSEFDEHLDKLTTDLLVPLRTSKVVDQAAMEGIRTLLRDMAAAIATEEMVPKALVGKLLFLFSSMLAEAGHAKVPGPIIAAAWDVEEHLSKLFGPRFE